MVIENEQVYMFDVDETLIRTPNNFAENDTGRIAVKDPYHEGTIHVYPIYRHIKLMRQMKGRGRYVIVWTARGAKWAQAVVDALGLKAKVDYDLILTKPLGYIDDKSCDQWMGPRIYETDGK